MKVVPVHLCENLWRRLHDQSRHSLHDLVSLTEASVGVHNEFMNSKSPCVLLTIRTDHLDVQGHVPVMLHASPEARLALDEYIGEGSADRPGFAGRGGSRETHRRSGPLDFGRENVG